MILRCFQKENVLFTNIFTLCKMLATYYMLYVFPISIDRYSVQV